MPGWEAGPPPAPQDVRSLWIKGGAGDREQEAGDRGRGQEAGDRRQGTKGRGQEAERKVEKNRPIPIRVGANDLDYGRPLLALGPADLGLALLQQQLVGRYTGVD